jgi:hypothetical protein
MEIEKITTGIVEDFISAYPRGGKIPAGLLELHMLQERTFPSPKEKASWLFDQIHDWAKDSLERCRQYEGIKIDPVASPLDSIKTDFSVDNPLLQSWSAIYYRYLVNIPLRVEKII